MEVPVVKPEVKKEVKVDKKEEPKKKELDKKEETKKKEDKKEETKKKPEVKKEKKIKKDKKENKPKKSKKKKKTHTKKTKVKIPKEQNTTPPCTPPPDAKLAELISEKKLDALPVEKEVNVVVPSQVITNVDPSPVIKPVDPPLVDYEDDGEDEEDIESMEIIESFPLSKDLFTKEDSPNTEEYVDNWENEDERTPVVPVEEEDSYKDGFSTPLFVNPSPPADHKFDDQGPTQEIVNGSSTPPISGTMRKREDSEEQETRIFKPSKQLFGIDDIYSDVLNRINPTQTKKPLTPPSSSSDSEEEIEERTTTPPLQLADIKNEPESPYGNFSVEDLAKIQKLDENLAKIQSMRSSYGDPADEFCEGLNKMEKFLTTARNITIQKYSSTPQFLVTLQEADLKDDQSPTVFQSSIKMVITPTKIAKNRIQSGTNLLGSDDEDDIVETEKQEVKKEEKRVVEEKVVVKEEKKVVVEVKKERRSTRSPEKKDRKPSKGKSESPIRKRRSRSPPKSLDKGHRRDRHVVGKLFVIFVSMIY